MVQSLSCNNSHKEVQQALSFLWGHVAALQCGTILLHRPPPLPEEATLPVVPQGSPKDATSHGENSSAVRFLCDSSQSSSSEEGTPNLNKFNDNRLFHSIPLQHSKQHIESKERESSFVSIASTGSWHHAGENMASDGSANIMLRSIIAKVSTPKMKFTSPDSSSTQTLYSSPNSAMRAEGFPSSNGLAVESKNSLAEPSTAELFTVPRLELEEQTKYLLAHYMDDSKETLQHQFRLLKKLSSIESRPEAAKSDKKAVRLLFDIFRIWENVEQMMPSDRLSDYLETTDSASDTALVSLTIRLLRLVEELYWCCAADGVLKGNCIPIMAPSGWTESRRWKLLSGLIPDAPEKFKCCFDFVLACQMGKPITVEESGLEDFMLDLQHTHAHEDSFSAVTCAALVEDPEKEHHVTRSITQIHSPEEACFVVSVQFTPASCWMEIPQDAFCRRWLTQWRIHSRGTASLPFHRYSAPTRVLLDEDGTTGKPTLATRVCIPTELALLMLPFVTLTPIQVNVLLKCNGRNFTEQSEDLEVKPWEGFSSSSTSEKDPPASNTSRDSAKKVSAYACLKSITDSFDSKKNRILPSKQRVESVTSERLSTFSINSTCMSIGGAGPSSKVNNCNTADHLIDFGYPSSTKNYVVLPNISPITMSTIPGDATSFTLPFEHSSMALNDVAHMYHCGPVVHSPRDGAPEDIPDPSLYGIGEINSRSSSSDDIAQTLRPQSGVHGSDETLTSDFSHQSSNRPPVVQAVNASAQWLLGLDAQDDLSRFRMFAPSASEDESPEVCGSVPWFHELGLELTKMLRSSREDAANTVVEWLRSVASLVEVSPSSRETGNTEDLLTAIWRYARVAPNPVDDVPCVSAPLVVWDVLTGAFYGVDGYAWLLYSEDTNESAVQGVVQQRQLHRVALHFHYLLRQEGNAPSQRVKVARQGTPVMSIGAVNTYCPAKPSLALFSSSVNPIIHHSSSEAENKRSNGRGKLCQALLASSKEENPIERKEQSPPLQFSTVASEPNGIQAFPMAITSEKQGIPGESVESLLICHYTSAHAAGAHDGGKMISSLKFSLPSLAVSVPPEGIPYRYPTPHSCEAHPETSSKEPHPNERSSSSHIPSVIPRSGNHLWGIGTGSETSGKPRSLNVSNLSSATDVVMNTNAVLDRGKEINDITLRLLETRLRLHNGVAHVSSHPSVPSKMVINDMLLELIIQQVMNYEERRRESSTSTGPPTYAVFIHTLLLHLVVDVVPIERVPKADQDRLEYQQQMQQYYQKRQTHHQDLFTVRMPSMFSEKREPTRPHLDSGWIKEVIAVSLMDPLENSSIHLYNNMDFNSLDPFSRHNTFPNKSADLQCISHNGSSAGEPHASPFPNDSPSPPRTPITSTELRSPEVWAIQVGTTPSEKALLHPKWYLSDKLRGLLMSTGAVVVCAGSGAATLAFPYITYDKLLLLKKLRIVHQPLSVVSDLGIVAVNQIAEEAMSLMTAQRDEVDQRSRIFKLGYGRAADHFKTALVKSVQLEPLKPPVVQSIADADLSCTDTGASSLTSFGSENGFSLQTGEQAAAEFIKVSHQRREDAECSSTVMHFFPEEIEQTGPEKLADERLKADKREDGNTGRFIHRNADAQRIPPKVISEMPGEEAPEDLSALTNASDVNTQNTDKFDLKKYNFLASNASESLADFGSMRKINRLEFPYFKVLILYATSCVNLVQWLVSVGHSVAFMSKYEQISNVLRCDIGDYDIVCIEWSKKLMTPELMGLLEKERQKETLSTPIFYCVVGKGFQSDMNLNSVNSVDIPPLPVDVDPLYVVYGEDLMDATLSRRSTIRAQVRLGRILKDLRGEVGTFQIIRRIGSGTVGDVYEVIYYVSKGKLAMKRIPLGVMSLERMDYLYKEVAIMRELDHGNIVQLSHISCDKSCLCIFMELCECTLQDLMDGGLTEFYSSKAAMLTKYLSSSVAPSNTRFSQQKNESTHSNSKQHRIRFQKSTSPSITSQLKNHSPMAGSNPRNTTTNDLILKVDTSLIVRDIVRAVKYLHAYDIVHRDIKPKNVLFLDGVAKLGDFGSATTVGAFKQAPNSKNDTVPYMAPEVFLGDSYCKACDIWSLGILFAEMLGLHLAHFSLLDFPALQEFYKSLNLDDCMPVVATNFVNTELKHPFTEDFMQKVHQILQDALLKNRREISTAILDGEILQHIIDKQPKDNMTHSTTTGSSGHQYTASFPSGASRSRQENANAKRTIFVIGVDIKNLSCSASQHQLPASLIELLESTFHRNPEKRITAEQLLEHPIANDRQWLQQMFAEVVQMNSRIHMVGSQNEEGEEQNDFSFSMSGSLENSLDMDSF